MEKQARIPSLDGARTISIALVIVSHLGILASAPILGRFDFGNLGVRVFFVISGFLITTLLVGEYERTGRVNLVGFYMRRFVRLAPAYWTYVGVVALLIPTGLIAATWHELIPTLAYYANYDQPGGVLKHVWSLAVEEQFYVIWPGLMVLLGLRKAYRGCIALLVIAPVFRVLVDAGIWPSPAKFAFECVADTLATGCALALLRDRLWGFAAYRWLVSSKAALLLPACGLMLLIALQPPFVVRDILTLPLINIGVALALDRYMRFPELAFGRLLNQRTMVRLGTLSYSIYLWQQLWVMTELPMAIKLAAILACATASYDWVEQPFLALRARLRARPSSVSAAVPA